MKRTKIIKAIQKALQGMTPIVEVKLYGSEEETRGLIRILIC